MTTEELEAAPNPPVRSSAPQLLYRFRPLARLLDSGELERQEIYFASPSELNDPMEGFRDLYWSGNQSRICGKCNHERTQPHDMAWAKLSAHLRGRKPPIRKGNDVRLERVFGADVKSSMLGVHLFFLKQFGCMVAEHGVPLDLNPVAKCMLEGTAHPRVRLAVRAGFGHANRK